MTERTSTEGEVSELPSGTVTFLFTDLVDSTRLWDAQPDQTRGSLTHHDFKLREIVLPHDGHVVKSTGDGLHAVFESARCDELFFAGGDTWPPT